MPFETYEALDDKDLLNSTFIGYFRLLKDYELNSLVLSSFKLKVLPQTHKRV